VKRRGGVCGIRDVDGLMMIETFYPLHKKGWQPPPEASPAIATATPIAATTAIRHSLPSK